MEKETITIPKEEYEELVRFRETDQELLSDIAKGMKDILSGNVIEV